MKWFPIVLILIFVFLSCDNANDEKLSVVVTDYYRVYQERQDFQKFLDFYDEDIVLEDIIAGERTVGSAALSDFFNWENSDFSLVDSFSLVIDNQQINRPQVVTQGYFTPFQWGNQTFPAMYFTTILTFNQANKIVKQVDWINYPNNLLNYENRKNSNDWILEKPK